MCNRLHDDTLQQYLQNIAIVEDPQSNYINCIYCDDDQFNESLGSTNSDIGVFHMNVRKLSKHRGELIAYLSSLSLKFDVIILSEIGDDAIHYLSTLLDDYAFFYQIPHNNRYGGIAIYVREDRLETAEREDLQIRKACNRYNFLSSISFSQDF